MCELPTLFCPLSQLIQLLSLGWLNKSSFFCSKFKFDLNSFSLPDSARQQGQIICVRPAVEVYRLFWQLATFISLRCFGRCSHHVASQSLVKLRSRRSTHNPSAASNVHDFPDRPKRAGGQFAARIRRPN